ncbi:hypothetical protein J6590_042452 [Homalodisca vitripennis]|nr:hypothetical protein J6590_042452 [Homalodisca vitripennis]
MIYAATQLRSTWIADTTVVSRCTLSQRNTSYAMFPVCGEALLLVAMAFPVKVTVAGNETNEFNVRCHHVAKITGSFSQHVAGTPLFIFQGPHCDVVQQADLTLLPSLTHHLPINQSLHRALLHAVVPVR